MYRIVPGGITSLGWKRGSVTNNKKIQSYTQTTDYKMYTLFEDLLHFLYFSLVLNTHSVDSL